MTDEEVQILIQAKNMAAPAMEEAKTLAKNLREAIDSLNRSTAEGATMAKAMNQAMNELTRGALEAGLSFDDTKVMVNETRTAMERYIAVVAAGMAPQEAYNLILDQTITEMAALTTDTDTATASQSAINWEVVQAIAIWLAWAAAIGAVVATLFPFVAVLGSALVIVTAFGVAATGMAVALGGASLMFLGLAGGVVLLANHFGTIAGPMQRFKNDLNALGTDLANKAAPAAQQILSFLERLMPTLDKLGSGVLKWFSGELPKGLQMIALAFNDLVPDFRAFGEFLGAMFDHVAPQIGPMFEAITRFGLGAIEGLISNLVRMSDWFQKELPTIGPAASQIFSGIGNAVQWIGTNFGNLADFLSKKWPDIVGVAKSFLDGFNTAFGAFNINMQGLGKFDAQGFFHGLGVVLGAVASIIWDVVRAITILVQQAFAALPAAISNIGDNITHFVNQFIATLNHLIDAYDKLPGFFRAFQTIPEIPYLTNGQSYAPASSQGPKHFAAGGTVPGATGAPMSAVVHGGEEVLSNDAQGQMIDLLTQLVAVALAQLDKMGSGGGYSALANLEYARSRGMT